VSSAASADCTLLLDASVWLAALDRDDPHHASAQQLLEAAATRAATIAALDLTLYEVANVAVVRWRSPADAERLAALVVLACPATLERVDEALVRTATAVAARHGLTVYDGAYAAAAARRSWTLVSGDVTALVAPGLAISPAAALARIG
jgi:predicted nucleic acid-binding protein